MTKPRAYSYTRFSTMEQRKGKSLERQIEASALWCKQKSVELDTELTLHDEGVSAFRGKNADTGALGAFLKAVHAGSVPRGSYLLVETFDRMSRESAYDAQVTLQSIINAGVTVVTLLDGKEYSVQILRADPLALIYAILLMSRSHEESATKSKRIGDAWRRKRRDIHKGITLTAQTPGWIELDEHRKPRLIARRAKLVQRMFQMFLEGTGKAGIASKFNQEKMPTFRGGRFWVGPYVYTVLTNPAVCGDFQPHREDTSKRTRTRIPDGPPIPNYYPSVIDRKMFDRAQKLILEQGGKWPVPRKGRTAIRNVLAGLARCSSCEGPVQRLMKAKDKECLFVCDRARHGAGCKYRSVHVALIEQTLIGNAASLLDRVPEADEDLGKKTAYLETEVAACETRIRDLAFLLDGTPSRTIAERIREQEETRDRHNLALETLQAKVQQSGVKRMREHARVAKSALLWRASDPGDTVGCNNALRDCFSKVVINFQQRELAMHWRHGPVTVLSY
jgi:DNA invertase Pin-like site-specific DNA recombinase